MNYCKTLFFLIVILLYSYIVGGACAKILKKNARFNKKEIFGFLILFLNGFIIGLPAQWLSISWNLYFIIFSVFLLASIIFATYITRDELRSILKAVLDNPILVIKRHLKEYWFIYVITFVFVFLAVTNTQPYLWCNYHDDYYIAKVVNLQGAPHLLDEQYALGLKLTKTSFFSLALQQGYRAFNTYELTYAYLGSLFHIDLTFFCRFSIANYMYYMCFLIYKTFAELFIDDHKKTQYTVLFFAILMIPAGYATTLLMKVRMFENWRFQTAIYYGGSFVRVFGLPLLIIACRRFLIKVDWEAILQIVGVVAVLFSFQVTALCYILFITPIIFFVKLISFVEKYTKESNKKKIIIILLITYILIILLADKLFSFLPFNVGQYTNTYNSYILYYNDIFIFDIFALTGFIPILMMLYLDRKSKVKTYIHLIVLMMYMVFRINKSTIFLSVITNYQFYGILRIITSVLLIVILYWGLLGYLILNYVKNNQIIIPILSTLLVISSITVIYLNENQIKKYTKEAQSATPLGYSIRTLTDNDKLIPDMVVKVGNYFNKMPYGNYRLLSEGHIPYKNTYIDNESFLLASNRIELFFTSTDDQTNIDYTEMLNYLKGKTDYSKVERIFKYAKFQYVFTTRMKCKNDLLKHKAEVVIEDTKHHYWLLRLQN